MVKILVTGSRGFVGSHMVARLVSRGHEVRAVDVHEEEESASGAAYRKCDIRDRAQVESAVAGMDIVYHVASLVQTRQTGAELVWAVNHTGTQHLLEASKAAGVGRFVYVSSASVVYEGHDIEQGDETLGYASSSQAPYADSKIAAERDVLAADDPAGMRTCALRPHVVFGPGDGRFMPALVARARTGSLKLGVGRGAKLSDFTYISNLIDGLEGAASALEGAGQAGGQAYFVTNGEPIPFWGFVDKMLVAMDQPPTRGRIPYPIAYSAAAVAETWNAMRGKGGPETGLTRFAVRYMCTHHYFSIEKAGRDLGYSPAVSIDEGIARTIAHLRDVGEI